MALAGLILGYAQLILCLLVILLFIGMLFLGLTLTNWH
jgi:hypothetical protein